MREAEEARSRALARIEHDENGAALVHDLRAAAEHYGQAAALLQERMRVEAAQRRRAS